jgi:hypothetical protein
MGEGRDVRRRSQKDLENDEGGDPPVSRRLATVRGAARVGHGLEGWERSLDLPTPPPGGLPSRRITAKCRASSKGSVGGRPHSGGGSAGQPRRSSRRADDCGHLQAASHSAQCTPSRPAAP